MTTVTTPLLMLKSGVEMPALGLGVFQSPPAETLGAVEAAIADGYRLIDTAAAYMNEREVGEGIRRSGIDRGDMFVTTKLWISDYGYEPALRGFRGVPAAARLRVRRPLPAASSGPERLRRDGRCVQGCRADVGGRTHPRDRRFELCPQHLENLMRQTDVVPAVDQVELHPFFTQQSVRDFHAANGIVTQAWSPLGGVNRCRPADADAVKNPPTSTRRSSSGEAP
jgi:diketogulonate reductase-like aldo/keto reductase